MDMLPLLRRDEFHDGGDPISHKCLEASRAPRKPVEDYGTICPSMDMTEGDIQHLTYMVK